MRSKYNLEVLPEITMLWKALSLSNFAVGEMLIESGLACIDNQMVRSGDTCLIKALKCNVSGKDESCINNEKDRDDLI